MSERKREEEEKKPLTPLEIIFCIILLVISVYSASISWNCKSNRGRPMIIRIIYAFFAFTFGVLYQIIHAFRKDGKC